MTLTNNDFKTLLINLRTELSKLEQENTEASAAVELDQQKVGRLSRMDAMQTQAMSQEAKRRRALKLARIELTLKQIEDDDYGYCVECDEPIAQARLQFDPTTTMCVDCANKLEQPTTIN